MNLEALNCSLIFLIVQPLEEALAANFKLAKNKTLLHLPKHYRICQTRK
jgi:hypothetical protein